MIFDQNMSIFGEYSDGARAFAAGGDFDDVIDGGGDFDLAKSIAPSQLPEMRMLRTVATAFDGGTVV